MTDHSRLAIVGAFGATYISLAIADIDELTVANFALLNSADFEKPMDAVARYLKSVPRWPDKASFAFTGQVTGDTARVDRHGWTVTKNDIRAATDADHVLLSRDLDALALMLPHLAPYDLVSVDKGTPSTYGTRLVISAGAALGLAALVHGPHGWVPVSGYAGEASATDTSIGPTQEDLLSGRGLVAVYERIATEKRLPKPLQGARAIAAKGLSGEDEAAAEAVRVMAAYLARYTADMALTFGASGGIYLAGGLAANILPPMAKDLFGADLSARIGERLGDVPVSIIKTGADAVIRGAALAMGDLIGATTKNRTLKVS
jgi:glucokinase